MLSRIVLVPLRHVPTGYVSYWLRFVQVGSSVAFGHGPADSCGHWVGAFTRIPSLLVTHRCLRPKCQSSQWSAQKGSINKGLPICVAGELVFSKSWVPVHTVTFLCKLKDSKLLLWSKGVGHIFDAVSRFGLRFEHRFEHRFRKTLHLHFDGAGANSTTSRNSAKSALQTRFLIQKWCRIRPVSARTGKTHRRPQNPAIVRDFAKCVF